MAEKRRAGVSRTAACLALAFMLLSVPIGGCGAAAARTLVIGSISLDPVGETRAYQQFADFVAGKLGSQGIDGGKVTVADSIEKMAELIRLEKVDLFIDSSVTALMVNELAGSKFLLRRWKSGRDRYRSVVFVRRESRFNTLADLVNESIAFEETFSTTGFMLPILAMSEVGMRLVPLDGLAQSPPDGAVGYVLGYDSETQMTWVERHQVAAAAMSENDYRSLAMSALVPLRVIYTSPTVPHHVVVYGSHLDDSLVARIRGILLNAHDSPQGADMLDGFEQTTMFDEIPEDLLNNVRKLAPGLRSLWGRSAQ